MATAALIKLIKAVQYQSTITVIMIAIEEQPVDIVGRGGESKFFFWCKSNCKTLVQYDLPPPPTQLFCMCVQHGI